MSERSNHKFQFSAAQIARAAAAEAEYHEQRVDHWRAREEAAAEKVRNSLTATLSKFEVTGGTRYSASVDYGDLAAWEELQLASDKAQEHCRRAERFRTDEKIYGTQVGEGMRTDRIYELDTDDVHHFRLGGGRREA